VRIVHFLHGRVNPNGTNGGDRVIYNLAKRTSETDAEVFILGLSDKPPLPVGHSIVRSYAPPRGSFSLPATLTTALREIDPDVVHFHGVYTPRNAILARWLRREGIPYAISPHGGLMEGVLARDWIRKKTYLKILGRGFCSKASFIHCVSDGEAQAVRDFVDNVPTVVAPHGIEGVDLGTLDALALRSERAALGNKRIFAFLGRLDPLNKGLDLVVEACARIRQSLKNAVVLLAGPDWMDRTAPLRKRVEELGLQDTVLFHGAIPTGPDMAKEKFNFLASCDVFIHPSRWEAGIPFSVLDALEVAKPCLVTEGTFFGEFFRRHSVGKQVPPTQEGVAKGLMSLAQASAQELDEMGAEGRRAVLTEFSWDRTAKQLLHAYGSMCRRVQCV
jgi:glycosyltransferase involved in cell wall biosynthesis